MRSMSAAAALSLIPTRTWAAPAVTENLAGTISGSQTIDIKGYSGPAGAVYSPSYEGAIFFPTSSPYQLTVDVDASSGFGLGLPGLQLATLFKSAPVSGQPLSPGDEPVPGDTSVEYLAFCDSQDRTPVEQLTYALTGGTR